MCIRDSSYNLLVYIDTGSSPKLIRLKKDKKKNVVQEVIATYEGRNSVDVSKMKEVINTAFSEYPAQSYGLVLWSHGCLLYTSSPRHFSGLPSDMERATLITPVYMTLQLLRRKMCIRDRLQSLCRLLFQ